MILLDIPAACNAPDLGMIGATAKVFIRELFNSGVRTLLAVFDF